MVSQWLTFQLSSVAGQTLFVVSARVLVAVADRAIWAPNSKKVIRRFISTDVYAL